MEFHKKPNTFVHHVRLKVSQLARSLDFYKKVIGFQILHESDKEVTLTADGKTPLITLEEPPQPKPKGPRDPGLYHIAILLPSRGQLGAFLRHIVEARVHLGASNHLVSEALYLSDPDGNGIEVYADRPTSEWQTKLGKVHIATEPLDAEDLLAAADEAWDRLPSGTIIGHLHLHVIDLGEAKRFYCDGLGFDVVFQYSEALFMSTGGYHHHIAMNTWNRAAEAVQDEHQVGLHSFSVLFPTTEARDQAKARLQKLQYDVSVQGENLVTEDPSGNRIELHVAT